MSKQQPLVAPTLNIAVALATPTLDYYNPEKPPTDEPGMWKKVVHGWRTEWIRFDEEPCLTPAAAQKQP